MQRAAQRYNRLALLVVDGLVDGLADGRVRSFTNGRRREQGQDQNPIHFSALVVVFSRNVPLDPVDGRLVFEPATSDHFIPTFPEPKLPKTPPPQFHWR